MGSKWLLCVDDDPDALSARKLLLEASGYSVITKASAQEALSVLAQGTVVDLVLLDYLMPTMNGDELADKLHEKHPDVPLVAVSGVDNLPPSLLTRTHAQVRKGQDPAVLLATIAVVLARNEREQGQTQFPDKRTVLCVEDEELQLKVRKMLFESAGYSVIEARSGSAALDAFTSRHVDAVVMDYWLCGKGGNGTGVAEEMKRLRPKIPIVMISSLSSLPGESAIVDLWVRKGEIEPQDLIGEVKRLIELRASERDNNKSA